MLTGAGKIDWLDPTAIHDAAWAQRAAVPAAAHAEGAGWGMGLVTAVTLLGFSVLAGATAFAWHSAGL